MSLWLLAQHEAAHAAAAIGRRVPVYSVEILDGGSRGNMRHEPTGTSQTMFIGLASGIVGDLQQPDLDAVAAAAIGFYGPEKYVEAMKSTWQTVTMWGSLPPTRRMIDTIARALVSRHRLTGPEIHQLLGTMPPERERYTHRSTGSGSRILAAAAGIGRVRW